MTADLIQELMRQPQDAEHWKDGLTNERFVDKCTDAILIAAFSHKYTTTVPFLIKHGDDVKQFWLEVKDYFRDMGYKLSKSRTKHVLNVKISWKEMK